ncbi:7-carboxy-7-deazaguanine synthase [Thiomicrospira sp. WB1]|uniref:7-carboxy-7-deazaguanine synthase n=1 Tax=Thiomicrospira sp. WB1 TaxID=1685380 RepID=UPI00074897A0|nr:7-carboxy-7-deazaguanine synthase [Thiomicrospira sp. WB1]KUJ71813.1 7-carboxy-7-deazaguanine synthase [Thiomicrospira sp. WB1]
MAYRIKEAFYSLQGEGFHSGRPAIFCRFAHCNLWTGLEADRHKAVCQFCDTDFVGTDGQNGGRFDTAEALVSHLLGLWPDEVEQDKTAPFVVLTGGEPLLQVNTDLIDAFHQAGFEIAVETNGTQKAPPGIDWLCVSPKAGAPLIQDHGDELKLVYPQPNLHPHQVADLDFDFFYLQPMADPNTPSQNTSAHLKDTLAYCLAHPQWRLSLQTHKLLGID